MILCEIQSTQMYILQQFPSQRQQLKLHPACEFQFRFLSLSLPLLLPFRNLCSVLAYRIYIRWNRNDIINLMKQQLNIQWNVYQMSQMGFNAISIKGRENRKLMSLDLRVLIILYALFLLWKRSARETETKKHYFWIRGCNSNLITSRIEYFMRLLWGVTCFQL